MLFRRGDIFLVDFHGACGSEQSGSQRPAIVVQNDAGNRHSTTTIVVPITSGRRKKRLPTHVAIHGTLLKPSTALCEQVRTVDRSRLIRKVGRVDSRTMKKIDHAMAISLGLIIAASPAQK